MFDLGAIGLQRFLIHTDAGEGILAALSSNNLEELRAIAPTFSHLLRQLESERND